MKLRAALFCILITAAPAAAQSPERPRLVRGDAAVLVEWPHVRVDPPNSPAWTHDHLTGSVAFGWYWTEHLNTTVEASTRERFSAFGSETTVSTPTSTPAWWTDTYAVRRFNIVQRYQFGHNRWVHPFVSAGLEIVAQRVQRTDGPRYVYSPVTGIATLVREGGVHPAVSDTLARASIGGGAKSYVHPRVFVLSDARVTFDSRPREVILRAGIGFDF